MDRNDREKLFHGLKSMSEEYNTFRLVLLKILKKSCSMKTMKRVIIIVVLCICCLPLMEYASISNKTYFYINNLIEVTSDLMIALFSSTLGGYALFQALTSGDTLISFLRQESDEMNKFEEFNLSFFSLTLGYLLIILINYLLKIILPIIKDGKWISSFGNHQNTIVIICIFLYVAYSIFLLLEMRSFIFNLFQCFNVNAISHGIKALKDDN
ncbi:hypothetical protein [Terrisporobacter mayombei]|uniref:hypothetical protein n=1 Tax=Terrisporobacter mayombei TaxID=1541 RepID=UPI0026590043|nr:hypothetical protein [Terrisporobacter mayombei]MCC3668626.1 hypothetical protein [Terrisporobacter mayombei]